MIAILKLVVFGFIGLTAIYWLVVIYSHSVRREKLEKEFDAGGIEGSRDDFVAAGLEAYKHGLRRRLIVLVYIIPTLVLLVTVYLVNWQ